MREGEVNLIMMRTVIQKHRGIEYGSDAVNDDICYDKRSDLKRVKNDIFAIIKGQILGEWKNDVCIWDDVADSDGDACVEAARIALPSINAGLLLHLT